MGIYSCDLHIHSVLSPCGSLEMSPKRIVEKALSAGLQVIAITDHNMTENCFYVKEAAKGSDLTVLCGMELQTQEEIHLLAIFDDFDVAFAFQKSMYELLPPFDNDPDYFGDQIVVNVEDEILREEKRLLLNSVQISVEDAVNEIKKRGGIVIPSHIDSPTFSIISQLGFVPENIPFDALEIKNPSHIEKFLPLIMLKNVPLVTFSDAHYINDIGRRRIGLEMEKPDCIEMRKALLRLGQQTSE